MVAEGAEKVIGVEDGAHCESPFVGSSYQVHNGKAYCQAHYDQLFGNVCSWCRKPVSGKGVRAAGSIFHADHFLCTLCDHAVPGGKFVAWEGKVTCKNCYSRLPKKVRDREAKIIAAQKKAAKEAAKAAKKKK